MTAGVARPESILRRSASLPDGSLSIARDDAMFILSSLSDAAAYRGKTIGLCKDCKPGHACFSHVPDEHLVSAYRSLSHSLGDDR
jgi:hypothetical protein